MNVDYILVAAGGITLPQLNLAIYASSNDEAIADATRMIEPLSKGGYFSFTLYSIKSEHIRVYDFRVITSAIQAQVVK